MSTSTVRSFEKWLDYSGWNFTPARSPEDRDQAWQEMVTAGVLDRFIDALADRVETRRRYGR